MEVLGLDVPLDVVSPFLECINGLCFILNMVVGPFYDQSALGILLIGNGMLAKNDTGIVLSTVMQLFQK